MIKVFAYLFQLTDKDGSIKQRIFCQDVGSDFYEVTTETKKRLMEQYKVDHDHIRLIDKVTSVVTLQQVLDAAKLDLKDYIINSKLSDDIQEIESASNK